MMTKPPTGRGKARKVISLPQPQQSVTAFTAPVTQRTVKLAHLLARITAQNINTLPKAS